MHLFYTPDIAAESYFLNEEETKHANRVLRLSVGEKVNLIDGEGGFYEAEIISISKRQAELKVLHKILNYGKRNNRLHIAVAPTKNIDRFEWFLEKATEIGIDEITPILCARSERKEIKVERLNKIITSAVKQSLQSYHPKLNPLISFRKLVSSSDNGQKFIAHCMDDNKISLKECLQTKSECLILVGPEGDFTSEELRLASDYNFKGITLGNSRLRTETAALEACFEVNFLNR